MEEVVHWVGARVSGEREEMGCALCALLEAFLAFLGDGQLADQVGRGSGGGASKFLIRDTAFSLPAFDLGSGC